jgi:hypothetical protein
MVIRYRPQVKEKGRWHYLAGKSSFGCKKLAKKQLKKVIKLRRQAGKKIQKGRVTAYRIRV